MKKIKLLVNHGREKAVKLSQIISTLLLKEGFEIIDDSKNDFEAVIAIGGDGTIIDAIRFAAEKNAPVLGINAGRLGFIAVSEEEDAEEKTLKFLKGKEGKDFILQERVGIQSDLKRNGKTLHTAFIVNDVVIKGVSKIANIGVSISGTNRINLRGDGVLVSTTTGSTAYNLSAGGPIGAPGVKCLFVTPICKQGLPIPSILIPEEESIELKVVEGDDVFLANDGLKAIPLKIGDKVVVKKSSSYQLVMFNEDHWYETLERKLYLRNHSGNH